MHYKYILREFCAKCVAHYVKREIFRMHFKKREDNVTKI